MVKCFGRDSELRFARLLVQSFYACLRKAFKPGFAGFDEFQIIEYFSRKSPGHL